MKGNKEKIRLPRLTQDEAVEICRQMGCRWLRRVHLGHGVTEPHCVLVGALNGRNFDGCDRDTERRRVHREFARLRRSAKLLHTTADPLTLADEIWDEWKRSGRPLTLAAAEQIHREKNIMKEW